MIYLINRKPNGKFDTTKEGKYQIVFHPVTFEPTLRTLNDDKTYTFQLK